MNYSYTMTCVNDCFLVKGSLRAGDFIGLAKRAGKGAVLCPNLARLADVNFAWGQPEAIAALTAQIISKVPAQPDRLAQWIKIGEHGLSSIAMVNHLAPGAMPTLESGMGRLSHPRDPSDLARCIKLLEFAPELVPLFPKMAEVSSVWAGLVGNWAELCRLIESEAPQWRAGRGKCIKTFNLMREIIEGKTP